MSTYLTRVPQHELRKRGGRAADTPDTRHRDVLSIFGNLGSNAREEAGALFRLERLVTGPDAYLVRSKVLPSNLTLSAQVIEEAGLVLPKAAAVSFRLSVNAVQRTKHGIRPVAADGAHELFVENENSESGAPPQIEITPWLQGKLTPGLEAVHIINHQREVLGATRTGRRVSNSRKVIQIDTIDGIAVVGDPLALEGLLRNGVGRAKAYGCGLLTVRPL